MNFCNVCSYTTMQVNEHPVYYKGGGTYRLRLCTLHRNLFSHYWLQLPPSSRSLAAIIRFTEYEQYRDRLIKILTEESVV